MKKRIPPLLLALTPALALVPDTASAEMTVPGTLCVPSIGSSPSAAYDNRGIRNTSTTASLPVHCPGQTIAAGTTNSVKATVYDFTTTTNDLCCSALVLNDDGSAAAISPQVCAPFMSTGPQELSFTVNAYGTLDVQCSIPKSVAAGTSRVSSYRYLPEYNSLAGGGFGELISQNGLSCTPTLNSSTTVEYDMTGIRNTSTTASLSVQCPGGRYYGSNTDVYTLRVYDRTPTANDFCCTGFIVNSDGTTVQSASGCAASYGQAVQDIDLTLTAAGTLDIACSIPKKDATLGSSYVASYSYASY